MKKLGQIGISLGLTLLIGIILYRGVPDWGQAWRVMIQGRPAFLLAGFGFVMLHMVLRALRWGVLVVSSQSRDFHQKSFPIDSRQVCGQRHTTPRG